MILVESLEDFLCMFKILFKTPVNILHYNVQESQLNLGISIHFQF